MSEPDDAAAVEAVVEKLFQAVDNYTPDPPLREPAAGGYSHLLASKRRIGGHLNREKGVTAHFLAQRRVSGYLDLLMSGSLISSFISSFISLDSRPRFSEPPGAAPDLWAS